MKDIIMNPEERDLSEIDPITNLKRENILFLFLGIPRFLSELSVKYHYFERSKKENLLLKK